MPRLPRSPLLLAVVLAAVPIAALAVALGPLHHAPPQSPPTTDTHTPQPLRSLIVADRFDLAPARAFGPIDISAIDEHGRLSISSYTLAAVPPQLPASAPVWRLRGFSGAPTVLQARLGVSPPTPEYPGDKFDGLIDPSQARLSAGDGHTSLLDAGAPATDVSSAIAIATGVLAGLGLQPQNADAAAARLTGAPPVWDVTWSRRAVAGLAVGGGTTPIARVDLTDQGAVVRIDLDWPSLDGGAGYPLRSVADAWAQVSRGDWLATCCSIPGAPIAFRADAVSLVEEQVETPAMLLVPAYVFTDTAHGISLSVPALTAADLSRPGGFALTQPGAQ